MQAVQEEWDPAEQPLSADTISVLKQRRVAALLESGYCKITR
jgi:hypothetical protein